MTLNELAKICNDDSIAAGWWRDRDSLIQQTPTKLALIHSEISEALEGFRRNRYDDHLPHREMAEVELADAIIRILDLAAMHGYDMDGAVTEKLAYNRVRADHQAENRAKPDGKKF
jgi:NTP pyrophosphatase (non-canonical NTP hydrolase)